MFSDLPQIVPQKICLSCQGCCRFKEASSLWRPKVTPKEVQNIPVGEDKKTLTNALLKDSHIATVHEQGQHRCTFLNLGNSKCGIYACRPFECRFYPFLLTQKDSDIVISVHLNCPYVQESRYSAEFVNHLTVLKTYLAQDKIFRFLKNNPFMMGDYSGCMDEIEELFILKEEAFSS